ncbi:hypothetical protein MVI01_11700 [Myxococcus virescens]|uniref:Uncharacterized protein n=1 Tax=Myxococcus virescens TaxID=83456 RepID=A0A511H767_9BACT|nr:hypothetical protein MVI01_11700 [Myxococcus virescens]
MAAVEPKGSGLEDANTLQPCAGDWKVMLEEDCEEAAVPASSTAMAAARHQRGD